MVLKGVWNLQQVLRTKKIFCSLYDEILNYDFDLRDRTLALQRFFAVCICQMSPLSKKTLVKIVEMSTCQLSASPKFFKIYSSDISFSDAKRIESNGDELIFLSPVEKCIISRTSKCYNFVLSKLFFDFQL